MDPKWACLGSPSDSTKQRASFPVIIPQRTMTSLLSKIGRRAFSPKYLFFTNTALGVSYLTAADVIQQTIIDPYLTKDQKKNQQNMIMGRFESMDLNRAQAMATGGIVVGALGHLWYTFLERKFPGKASSTIAKKLACEVAAGPPWGLVIFSTVGVLEGKSLKDCWNSFTNNLVMFCIADWCFYVPLQFLNFYFLPPQFRFLFVSGISLVYDIFLSFLLHRDHSEEPNEDNHETPSPAADKQLVCPT